MMKNKSLLGGGLLAGMFLITSCAQHLKTGNGGFTDLSLQRSSDEYTIKRLDPIEMDGKAVFGIPVGSSNNRDKNKRGMIFKFNGIELGGTSRALPVLTLIGATLAYGSLVQSISGTNNDWNSDNYGKSNISFPVSLLIGAPLAGITNNLIWSGAAASGITNQVYHKLVAENPDVDVFLTPRYTYDYQMGLFTQKAKVRAQVTGATLKLK